MKDWLRLIIGTLAIGVIWAAAWAATGALIGIMDPGRSLHELWVGPPIGMHPGFVGGVLFAAALGIAAWPRRFDELPPSIVVGCGALVGVLLGLLPLAINKPPGESPLWLVAVVVIGSMTLMSVASAAGSLALARGVRATSR